VHRRERGERALRKTKGTVGGLIAPKAARRQDAKTGALPDQTRAPKPETEFPSTTLRWENVPEEMFTEAWNFSLEVSQYEDVTRRSRWHVGELKKVLHEIPSTGELDLVALRKARQALRSFSLITINTDTYEISMHPLVHAWAKDRLDGYFTTPSLGNIGIHSLPFHRQSIISRLLQQDPDTCRDVFGS
jgi:hypothetical protein